MTPPPPPVDLFVIGAMKAATTGMCDLLARQPGVSLSVPKEPTTFVRDRSADELSDHLAGAYAAAQAGSLRVDGSTDYAKYPSIEGVPRRVRAHNPDARFVYLMRHPVARTISQYRFEWLMGADTMSFEKALATNPQLIDNSRYAMQLRHWLEWFSSDRILLVFAEQFARNPEAEVRRVLDHAGVRRQGEVAAADGGLSNASDVLVRHGSLARRLLRDSSFGRAIRPLVPAVVARSYHSRQQRRSKPDITPEVEAMLVRRLDLDLAELRDMTAGPELTCHSWTHVSETWTPVLQPA